MDKSLVWKIVLIIVLVLAAAWFFYPPGRTLKPGIDLAGGTSLIYEIDTQGLEEAEKKELAQRMITVLRRRIDPGNIQNLIWRPQGNTRFEIQMPLASEEAHQKRQDFDKALNELLAENINPATIMRSIKKPAEERTKDFEKFARNSANKLTILNNLATAYDERKAAQAKRDQFDTELKTDVNELSSAGLELAQIEQNIAKWITLNEQELAETLRKFLGSDDNLDIISKYVKTYSEWTKAVEQLTKADTGKNALYEKAKRTLDKFNLTAEQVNSTLDMSPKSGQREQAIENLRAEFEDRAEKIDNVIAAYDTYRPLKSGLDDPKDLQRMLKGAGILEFRILPTTDPETNPEMADSGEMAGYVERLKTKGPKYASDNKYVWCEVESEEEAKKLAEGTRAVVAPFGNKFYVLASNKPNETMLHGTAKEWSLKRAQPQSDETGKRAIGFTLDEKGGNLFFNVTGKNLNRPLCILLDGTAISAPNIRARIRASGIITGNFTQTEVVDMVNKLNAGSLPARLVEQPISVKTIGPAIGADNRDKGIRAGIIGLAGVVLCMAIYYTLGGVIADAALLMNILFTLAIMASLRATYTLPGIAGTILTIGMSVDANVLIFERIREEQQRGCSLRMAIKNGYERAFVTIFDSNLTTVISAVILYWVASEDIKGFAIVLILGLASSMFTALFVTRTIFDFLLSKRIIKDHLVMLHLIRKPNINWMRYRPLFFTLSAVLTIGGLFIFFTRDDTKNSKYDIEFTGGTSIQINLKDNVNLTRQDVENNIRKVGEDLKNPALAAATVYGIGNSGKQYEITTTETNKTKTTVTFPAGSSQTVEGIISAIGDKLSKVLVTANSTEPSSFTITTNQLNRFMVENTLKSVFPTATVSEPVTDEIVNNAVLTAFADSLEIKQNLQPKIISQEKITEKLVDSYPELADFIGGIKITCETARAATAEELGQRFNDLRFKPEARNLTRYPEKILNTDLTTMEPNQPVKSFVYISVNPEAAFRQMSDDEWALFVENEKAKVLAAAEIETSLPRVTQIDPSVGGEAKNQAMVAIVLSLIAMLIYIWVRFGNLRYGLGAVITLFHDTCVTVGVVTGCTYIAATTIGQALLIGDFKIDLAMIAAFLTLLGYSINDTIVIYDRIRENRHKGTILTPQIINDSINETLSRTLLTGFTTLLVVAVMYIFGGKGLRGFNFAMLFGIVLGTYSSVAISAPILLFRAKLKKQDGK